MNDLLGTLYFAPVKGDDGRVVSEYRGVVVGFIIKRDDGVEYEVRSPSSAIQSPRTIKWDDLPLMKIGQQVTWSKAPDKKYKVLRVYPSYGDVWIAEDAANGAHHAVKFFELSRV